MVQFIEAPTREAWLAERTKGIGGSDIAAICGIHPFMSPIDVWLEKTGKKTIEENEAMKFGRILEPIVAEEFAVRNKAVLKKHDGLFVDDSNELFRASVDRTFSCDGYEGVLEIKTTRYSKGWIDGVPPHVEAQLQWYLGILQEAMGYVAVLIGGQDYKDYFVGTDPKSQEAMKYMAVEFWDKFIKTDTMPPATATDRDSKLVRELFKPSDTTYIDLPAEAARLIEDWHQAKYLKNEWTEKEKKLSNQIKQQLQNHEYGRAGEWTVHNAPRAGRTTCDHKRFDKDHPGLIGPYLKVSESYSVMDAFRSNEEE